MENSTKTGKVLRGRTKKKASRRGGREAYGDEVLWCYSYNFSKNCAGVRTGIVAVVKSSFTAIDSVSGYLNFSAIVSSVLRPDVARISGCWTLYFTSCDR